MRVIIAINCNTNAFAMDGLPEGASTEELLGILLRLMQHLLRSGKPNLEDFDEPLFLRDSNGEVVGRMTVTADPE
jgi:hypothetical protein